MRNVVAAAILTLGLCGCSDIDSFFGSDSSDAAQPAPVNAAATAAETPTTSPAASMAVANESCTNLARQRASDAAYQGEDEETQEAVYNRTLASCTDWERRHAL